LESRWGTAQSFSGNAALNIWGGTGAPANAQGVDGDFYLRKDGGTGTSIYQRRAGVWTGIL
jgi:hypothetical protein